MGEPAGHRARALAAWADVAATLDWATPPQATFVGEGVQGRWFPGGRLSAAHNCLDRHLPARADQPAVLWEGEPGDRRVLTYAELHHEVCALAEALQGLGVRTGDVVALYLGWIPEVVVAMLACARLGAVHLVIPVPVPSDALADRLASVEPAVIITQDGAWRHGMMLPLKARADEALEAVPVVHHTIVVRRTGIDVSWYEGDRWYHELVAARRPGPPRHTPAPAVVVADHPLLVTNLPGRRGEPTVVELSTAGVLATSAAVLDGAVTAGEDAVLWCAVEVSWAAGQTHGVYAPLLGGSTAVMYEGVIDTPTPDRAWEIVERYGVTSLLAAPSVWRSLRGWSPDPPAHRARSLRYCLATGDRTDAATRRWLDGLAAATGAVVGEAWGQTELAGAVLFDPPHGPGLPDPGLDVVDEAGRSLPPGARGELVMAHPWPTLPLRRGHEGGRHWVHDGRYATSDLAERHADGRVKVLGRLDPMLSVSGQLVSATEVRDVLAEHPLVQQAEVVERVAATGEAVVAAFVVVTPGTPRDDAIAADLRAGVREVLGGLATPHVVAFCDRLDDRVARPVLRRALWRIAAGTLGRTLQVTSDALEEALEEAREELP